jgi:hypothetical protein
VPGPQVLERARRSAPIAVAPTAAVLVYLHRDQLALYPGQDRLAPLQAEAKRRCGVLGRNALARADLVPLRRAVRPGQFQHDPPSPRVPAPQPPATDIAPPKVLAGLLVDHAEHPELAPVPGTVLDEVIGPDVIRPLRPQPDGGAVVQPQTAALRLPRRHLQLLLPPDPAALDALVVGAPARTRTAL